MQTTITRLASILLVFGLSPCALSGTYNVTLGVFAQSDFCVNENRRDTYLGSDEETGRNVTYLPGNTIIYNTQELDKKESGLPYSALRGVTQSGIPVIVKRGELSEFPVGDGEYQDVVVHRAFDACSYRGCQKSEQIRVGEGTEGFRIDGENWRAGDDDVDVTLVSRNGARLKFSRGELLDLEAHGVLTIHEGRKFPRFRVLEGYASRLSRGCGGAPTKKEEIDLAGNEVSRIPSKPFDKDDPETWTVNSPQWDRKAIEIFGWADRIDGDKIALKRGLQASADTAIDITVFALVDSERQPEDEEYRRFGALLSFVACTTSSTSSDPRLSYVRSATFSSKAFGEIELPQQLTSEQKQQVFREFGGRRSFLYSINSSQDFHTFFESMSESLDGRHHYAAFLISRLNATCKSNKRNDCAGESKYDPSNF